MRIQTFSSLAQMAENQWQKLVPPQFPFVSYQFLHTLEVTGCLGPRTGWHPSYLTAWENDELVGAIILFHKSNSYGEYIFDFAWAQAHAAYGIEYYPKLVAAIPFTPATGPKLLTSQALSPEKKTEVGQSLLNSIAEFSHQNPVSSSHALFISPDEVSKFQNAGYFLRDSFQFHWFNRDYKLFSDFLADLKSKRRREILRERNVVRNAGLTIHRLNGNQLTPEHADLMYDFYLSTVEKKQGFAYLTRDFFEEIFSTFKNQILLVLAKNSMNQPIAGALNYLGNKTIFGRQWGCLEEHKALHFELCYYQGIEFAIDHGLTLFEAGAQGEHKFPRGFRPTLTYSAHQIKDSKLNLAIQNFVIEERRQLRSLFSYYKEHSPFIVTDSLSIESSP